MSSNFEDQMVILCDLKEHICTLRIYLEMFRYAKHIDQDVLLKFNNELYTNFADDVDILREINAYQYWQTFRRVNELLVGIRSIEEVISFCNKSERQINRKISQLKQRIQMILLLQKMQQD